MTVNMGFSRLDDYIRYRIIRQNGNRPELSAAAEQLGQWRNPNFQDPLCSRMNPDLFGYPQRGDPQDFFRIFNDKNPAADSIGDMLGCEKFSDLFSLSLAKRDKPVALATTANPDRPANRHCGDPGGDQPCRG
jgi:hypothetical protein